MENTMKRLMALLTACAALAGLFAMGQVRAEDKPLTVGAIYVGSVNDYGYNRAMKDGLEEMKKNIPGLKLIEAENVPETAESERIMEGMIQQGAKLIFATSFGHQQFAFISPRPIPKSCSNMPAAGCRRRISATSSAPRSRPGIRWAWRRER
jgi:ABC-type sugar transport system substrate-binding protein